MLIEYKRLLGELEEFSSAPRLSCDTETTGLRPYHGDYPFSIILCNGEKTLYLNLKDYGDDRFPSLSHALSSIRKFFKAYKGLWFFHNAKFDMHHLWTIGVDLNPAATVHCTKAIARLIRNDLPSYSLDSLSNRWLGEEKDDAVMDYIMREHLWEWEEPPGIKVKRRKRMHFDQVPPEIIIPYAEKDAELTYKLGMLELRQLDEYEAQKPPEYASIKGVYRNECELTWTLWEMENRGVRVDLDYCREAFEFESRRMDEAAFDFKCLTNMELSDGRTTLLKVFEFEKLKTTDKGNPCFDSEALSELKHPAASVMLRYRDARSRANFFAGFANEADKHGIVHASFWQDGTITGRLSSSSPNLQNLTKDQNLEDGSYPIRRAIVPRLGQVFHMLDYDQVEYRLMLEYANARGLMEKVKAGTDVHQATADAAGIDRQTAKTINFTTLYGGGTGLIARRLQTTPDEAKRIVSTIFSSAPEIPHFINRVRRSASLRGSVVDWFGRPIRVGDKTHAAVNYLIQGGCADVMKLALNEVRDLLLGHKTRPVLTIHDEIVFEGPEEEAYLIPQIKKIMETVYPSRVLPLTTGIDHSARSLADKTPGVVTSQASLLPTNLPV